MRRVLIVAYQFPPLGGIGSARVTAFANHLLDYGWEATVLAPSDAAHYRDRTLDFPEERVVRARSLEISRTSKRVLRAGGDAVTPAEPGAVGRQLQRAARALFYYPDPKVGWYVPAVIAGRRTVRSRHFDAIFSSASPVTTHLVARRLQAMTGLPWIAEFRDPWADVLYQGAMTRRARGLETSIAGDASALVMTSPSWAAVYGERWKRPVTVITNGCDGPVASRPDDGRFVLAHLGTMYPDRHRLASLWDAMAATQSIDAIRFIGALDPGVRAELEAAGLGSRVQETGFVPHAQAIELMAASSVLLLAGPCDASGLLRGWIPAKLFEYLATDLPILYIGDPGADAASVLRPHPGCHVLDPGDVDGIAAALEACRGRRYTRDLAGVSRRALTGALAGLLDEITSDRSPRTPRASAMDRRGPMAVAVTRAQRQRVKHGYFEALSRARADVLLRRIRSSDGAVLVLNFHRVAPVRNPFWAPITPDAFSELASYLAANCRVTSFDGLRALPARGAPRVVLSFDDGYRDFVDYAMPILDRFQLPANQNVIVQCLETGLPPWIVRISDALNAAPTAALRELRVPGFDERLGSGDYQSKVVFGTRLAAYLKSLDRASRHAVSGDLHRLVSSTDPSCSTAMMSRAEVQEAAAIHEIGGHSYSHEPLAQLSHAEFVADLDRCLQLFAELGRPMRTYAFPFGSCRPGQVEALRQNGVAHVLVVGERPAKLDADVYSRITMFGETQSELRLRALGVRTPRL